MTRQLPDQLQTERLLLREPRATDARLLFAAYTQEPEVSHYMVWRPHTTVDKTEAFIAHCIDNWNAGRSLPYVLALRESPTQAIGMLEARILGHMIDIGYVLSRPLWGRGLMPEAVRALTQAALSTPDIYRIQATCDVENLASVKTLEKSGFVCEARLERHTVHPNMSSEPRPCFMYALCK